MAAELWQRRKKRRRMGLLAGAAAVIAAAVAVGGIFAYYTSHQQMTNTFTVGQNTTTIEEEFDSNPVNDVYKKAVQIANKGDVPCYVRVYVAFSDEEVADISQLSPDGKNYYTVSEYVKHLPDGWTAGSDGYLYYTKLLPVDGKTSKVVSSVKTTWRPDMDRHDFDLIVREESVQVPANNPGADYKAAWADFHAGEVK